MGVSAAAAPGEEEAPASDAAARAMCVCAAAAPGEEEAPATDAAARAMLRKRQRARRLDWEGLLRKRFAVDDFSCPRCGGRRRVLAYLTQGRVIRRILGQLHLPEQPPPQAPARGPAQQVLWE